MDFTSQFTTILVYNNTCNNNNNNNNYNNHYNIFILRRFHNKLYNYIICNNIQYMFIVAFHSLTYTMCTIYKLLSLLSYLSLFGSVTMLTFLSLKVHV